MSVEIKLVKAGDDRLFGRIAEGAFDKAIDGNRLAAYLAEPNHHMIIALQNGEVVGQVAAVIHRHPDKPTELYIDEVGVAFAFQRRGIARQMLDAMLTLGKKLGCEEAWVGTEHDNIPAQRLYGYRNVPPQLFVLYEFEL